MSTLGRYILVVLTLLYVSCYELPGQLRVSDNGRYLVKADGSPFFWLGDTGWALFQKLDREEVKLYLETRARQGFTVIHAAIFNINPFVLPPLTNKYGDLPFIHNNPLEPAVTPGNDPRHPVQYDYWDHVEYVIDQAAENGLIINILPVFGIAEGRGYNLLNRYNAYTYGLFLGERFKDKSNLIWCMGGDVLAETKRQKKVWNLLARGVTEGVAGIEDYNKTLMTYHVRGGHSSSDYFPDAPWLDIHMIQTWASYSTIYQAVSSDYVSSPVKPVLHGEGAYEAGPEYPTGPITPHLIRKQAFWAWFAGGMHTYGNSNVWNFGTNPYYVSEEWEEALWSPGARDLILCRKILESMKWWTLIPDQSVIVEGTGSDDSLKVAMRSESGDKILAYFPGNTRATIDLSRINPSDLVTACWINPGTGEEQETESVEHIRTKEFQPPSAWEDALLILEIRN